MASLLVPNSFQTPNVIIDKCLKHLTGEEAKCLLVLIRKTFGFQQESAPISHEYLIACTGLSSAAVTTAMTSLKAVGLVVVTKGADRLNGKSAEYALELDSGNVLFDELAARTSRRQDANRKRIEKARAARGLGSVGQNQEGAEALGPVGQGQVEGGALGPVGQGHPSPVGQGTLNPHTDKPTQGVCADQAPEASAPPPTVDLHGNPWRPGVMSAYLKGLDDKTLEKLTLFSQGGTTLKKDSAGMLLVGQAKEIIHAAITGRGVTPIPNDRVIAKFVLARVHEEGVWQSLVAVIDEQCKAKKKYYEGLHDKQRPVIRVETLYDTWRAALASQQEQAFEDKRQFTIIRKQRVYRPDDMGDSDWVAVMQGRLTVAEWEAQRVTA